MNIPNFISVFLLHFYDQDISSKDNALQEVKRGVLQILVLAIYYKV